MLGIIPTAPNLLRGKKGRCDRAREESSSRRGKIAAHGVERGGLRKMGERRLGIVACVCVPAEVESAEVIL